MGKLGRRYTERIVKFDVLWRVGKVVFTTNHVCELHFDVVHHIHKMENPRSIGTTNRHVGMRSGIRHIELDPTADEVLDDDGFAG